MTIKKRILLVGAGPYGQKVASELQKTGIFSSMIITDLFLEKAKTTANNLAEKEIEISAEQLDATREEDLLKVMKDVDMVANVSGPMQDTAAPTVRACIKMGINYVDTSATMSAAQELLALDKEAKAAGISVLTGFGGGSGMVNFLARYGADKLDTVNEIHFAVVGYGYKWPPMSRDMSDEYLRAKFTNPATIYSDGQFIDIKPTDAIETIEIPGLHEVWPELAGTWDVWPIRFSQIATIPYFIRGVKTVTVKAGQNPFSELSRLGLDSLKPIFVKGNKVLPIEFAIEFSVSEAFASALGLEMPKDPKVIGGWYIKVAGEKHGKPASYTYGYIDVDMHNTERAFAMAAKMLFDGDINLKGVIAPEAVDPKPFLRKALEWGTIIREISDEYIASF
jgi:saccharopine dehydrogenase-like NADP-dependent oxidoreductase